MIQPKYKLDEAVYVGNEKRIIRGMVLWNDETEYMYYFGPTTVCGRKESELQPYVEPAKLHAYPFRDPHGHEIRFYSEPLSKIFGTPLFTINQSDLEGLSNV